MTITLRESGAPATAGELWARPHRPGGHPLRPARDHRALPHRGRGPGPGAGRGRAAAGRRGAGLDRRAPAGWAAVQQGRRCRARRGARALPQPAGVFDLDGHELAGDSRDHEVGIGPDELMPQVAARLTDLLADVAPPVVGVGLSLPGSVDADNGVSRDAPVMAGWDGVALAPYLAEVADAPFFVANDADVLARSDARRPGHAARRARRQGLDRSRARHHRGRPRDRRPPRSRGRDRPHPPRRPPTACPAAAGPPAASRRSPAGGRWSRAWRRGRGSGTSATSSRWRCRGTPRPGACCGTAGATSARCSRWRSTC